MKKLKISLLVAASVLLLSPIGGSMAIAGPGEIIPEDSSNTLDKDDNSNEIIPPDTNTDLIQSKKMVITSVSTDQNTITPGKPFTLTVKVKNMTSSKLEKVSLNIGLSPSADHKQTFIPVGTTNEIYVGTVDAKKEKSISITLVSNPKLETGTYSFNTNILFNSPGESQEAISLISGIIVSSPSSISISNPSFTMAGGSSIIGSVYNDSDSEIKDIMVEATINGEKYKTTIPTIDADDEMDFQISIPDATNDTEDREVHIKAYYINNLDEEVSTSTDFTIFAGEGNMGGDVPTAPIFPEEKPSFWMKIKSWLGLGV